MRTLGNAFQLGLKELRSLYRDPALLVLIVYAFTVAIYSAATAQPESPHRATLAVVDEDQSQVSQRILNAFQLPYFLPPEPIDLWQMDSGMDAGLYTFTLNIPPDFQADLLAGRSPTIQLNVDATQVSQAFTGAGHIQQIINDEVTTFVQRYRADPVLPVEAVVRIAFNPNLTRAWFGAVNEVINQITMLSIILTGAALIREREHGTIEHLLVMPVTPAQIMLSKVWSMALVVLIGTLINTNFATGTNIANVVTRSAFIAIIAVNSAEAQSWPSTKARPSNFQILPPPRRALQCNSSTSPGTTMRRNLHLSMPMK